MNRIALIIISIFILNNCAEEEGISPNDFGLPNDGKSNNSTVTFEDWAKVTFLREMVCYGSEDIPGLSNSGFSYWNYATTKYINELYSCRKNSKTCKEYERCYYGSDFISCDPSSTKKGCDGNFLTGCTTDNKGKGRQYRINCAKFDGICTSNTIKKEYYCRNKKCMTDDPKGICDGETNIQCGAMPFTGTFDCNAVGAKCDTKNTCIDKAPNSCTTSYCHGTATVFCIDGKSVTMDCSMEHPNYTCKMTSGIPKCVFDETKATCEYKKGDPKIVCEGDVAKICVEGKILKINCQEFSNSKCVTNASRTGCSV